MTIMGLDRGATRYVITLGPPPDTGDPEVDLIVAAGLPHLIRRLADILDSLDERIAWLKLRADLGGLPPRPDGIPDDLAERYFASYSLLPERFPSAPPDDPERAGADRSGVKQHAA